ncbi:MAG: 4-alpha-glucanotransferase [Mariprofundaceae bacterium]
MTEQRNSGILLHVSSLPGPFASGVLGAEARGFIDQLAASGCKVWQFLPVGPTHDHGSPYESLSTFAGNPAFIDLRDCVTNQWLDAPTLQQVIAGTCNMDTALTKAAKGFFEQVENNQTLDKELNLFRCEHANWLEDFLLFFALKQAFNHKPWWQWPLPLRDREPEAMQAARHQYKDHIRQHLFEQFVFARQWQAIKLYAEHKSIQLFGDLPIYVAHDSADVWAHRELFTVNELGACDVVAGVPPDYFSESGQRWGNPLYRWDKVAENDFSWWIERVEHQLTRMHLMRIDHFRGLESCWAIPGDRQDGRIGEWLPVPGHELLMALKKKLGKLPFVAEDLGIITPEVDALRHGFNLPGMKILHFAFGSDEENPYLPHNHERSSVVYTGTHDNDTTLGWFASLPDDVHNHLAQHVDMQHDTMPWPLIHTAMASVAQLAIIPMQDVLALDSKARFNTPGTCDGNWSWRMQLEGMTDHGWQKIKGLNISCQR